MLYIRFLRRFILWAGCEAWHPCTVDDFFILCFALLALVSSQHVKWVRKKSNLQSSITYISQQSIKFIFCNLLFLHIVNIWQSNATHVRDNQKISIFNVPFFVFISLTFHNLVWYTTHRNKEWVYFWHVFACIYQFDNLILHLLLES